MNIIAQHRGVSVKYILFLCIYIYMTTPIVIVAVVYMAYKHRKDKINLINSLIRQVYRWHFASMQDSNPVVKMLHSNYAEGYVEALKTVSDQIEIKKITGLDITLLENEITREQDKALAGFVLKCPNIYPRGTYSDYVEKYILKNLK